VGKQDSEERTLFHQNKVQTSVLHNILTHFSHINNQGGLSAKSSEDKQISSSTAPMPPSSIRMPSRNVEMRMEQGSRPEAAIEPMVFANPGQIGSSNIMGG
jgi:hypothetical protein